MTERPHIIRHSHSPPPCASETRHADHDRQAADVCDPVADRGRDRDVPADARAARRSRGVFRRARRHQGGGRADPQETRPRQAADRAVLPLHQRSRPWRFRQFADDGPAGRHRNPQPPAGLRRTDAARPLRLDRDRDPARRARRHPPGLVDRPSLPRHDHGRRLAAGVLHRPGAGLRLLFQARLVAGAARPARRVLQRAARR